MNYRKLSRVLPFLILLAIPLTSYAAEKNGDIQIDAPVGGYVDSGGDEAADALVGLGYSREEARSAVMGIEGATVEERVRAALKRLGRRG